MNKSIQVLYTIDQSSLLLSFFWLNLEQRDDPQLISMYLAW